MRVKVDMSGVREQLEEKISKASIEVLTSIGKQSVDMILTRHDWMNQTGCLHSSVGGVVAQRGEIVSTFGFNAILDGAEGRRTGMELATDIALRCKSPYCCIVVAGMDYAGTLESNGRDVIASTDLWVKGQANMIVEQIVGKVNENRL